MGWKISDFTDAELQSAYRRAKRMNRLTPEEIREACRRFAENPGVVDEPDPEQVEAYRQLMAIAVEEGLLGADDLIWFARCYQVLFITNTVKIMVEVREAAGGN
jgi:hypothetical protein